MTCDTIRQLLLSLDLDEKSRRRVSEALGHLESCEACRHALQEFDQLVMVLRAGGPDEESLPPLDESENVEQSAPDGPPQLFNETNVSPTGGWEAFESKLLAATRGSRQPYRSMRTHWWLPVLGSLAAMVLVGWYAFHHLGKKAAGEGAPLVHIPEVAPSHSMLVAARLSPDDVAEKVRTFDAVDHSFDGKTGWLMLSGPNNTDVGLIDSSPGSPTTRGTGDKILLVRLNLVRGAEVVSEADVLIVAGTTANVVVPTKLGAPVQYHIVTSALDPMRLQVQVRVPKLGGAETAANPQFSASNSETAVLGTSIDLEPYLDASAGRLVLGREAFDLQIAAAASNLHG